MTSISQRATKRATPPAPLILPASGFLALLLVLGAPQMTHAQSGTGMKGPPSRGPAEARVELDSAGDSTSRQLLLAGIRFFQKRVSPVDGSRCNFFPTCSHFGSQAVQSRGALLGMLMTADRLMRCHYLVDPDAGYVRLPNGRLHDPVDHNLPHPPL